MRETPACRRRVPPGGERQPFHFRSLGARAPGRFRPDSMFPPMFPFPPVVNREPNSGLFAARPYLIPFALANRGLVLGIDPAPAGPIPSGNPTGRFGDTARSRGLAAGERRAAWGLRRRCPHTVRVVSRWGTRGAVDPWPPQRRGNDCVP